MADNDFKYVIQDVSSTQLGSRFTYEEILMNDRVPFKFQTIISMYILREMKADNPNEEFPEKTEIGKHIFEIKDGSLIYNVYNRLKLKIRYAIPNPKGGYKVKQANFDSFKELTKRYSHEEIIIQDITISNLSLMTFSI